MNLTNINETHMQFVEVNKDLPASLADVGRGWLARKNTIHRISQLHKSWTTC